MTPQDKLDLIRQKVFEANPDEWKSTPMCRHCGSELYPSTGTGKIVFPWQCTNCGNYQEAKERPIRLADVLLAMNDSPKGMDYGVTPDGRFIYQDENAGTYLGTEPQWTLREDDLTKQSPETVAFLYDLLK